ncbi:MAG: hypothetical protein QM758_04260 [Armatimonas sp.]
MNPFISRRGFTHLFAIVLLSALAAPSFAQKYPPQLPIKVGDRVEIRGYVGNPRRGRITEFGTGQWEGFLRVKYEEGDSSANGDWQSAPGVEGRFFLLDASGNIVGDIYKPRDRAPIPPKRTPLKAPKQTAAKSGAPPTPLVRALIQSLWEGMSDTYTTINLDLHSVQIGTPRLWKYSWSGHDIGSGVPGETMVYPVKSRWTLRRYSQSQVVILEVEGIHNFYINAFHVWQCGLAESKNLKPMQTVPLSQ